MRRALIAPLFALMLLVALLSPASPATALAKIKCKEVTGIAVVDPIKHHDEPVGTGHLHQFFGNAGWLSMDNPNQANYDDLVGGPTNCRDTQDSAGYWQPAVVDTRNGDVLVAQAFTAYYRTFDGKQYGPTEAFPADTRLTAMQAGTSPGAHGWSCGQNSGALSKMVDTIPDCSRLSQKPGQVLTAHINFPSCWDGVAPDHQAGDVGDTSDDAHYAYPVRSGSRWVCPAGFGHHVPQLRETIQYPNPDKVPASALGVTSDPMMGGHNGSSMHGDFFNAWVQSGLEDMLDKCVRQRTTSSICDL